MITARRLVNLDTEDFGDLFIGCAGGGDSQITLPASPADDASSKKLVRFRVSGLLGGHSGININDDRGNAVILVARLADAASRALSPSSSSSPSSSPPSPLLVSYAKGGDKRNALAREATIEAWVPDACLSGALEAAKREGEAIKEEYGLVERDIAILVEEALDYEATFRQPLDARSSDALLTLLLTLPHGVIKMSHAVEGLVETSTNLASVAPEFGDGDGDESGSIKAFKVCCSTRSSLMPALEAARRSIHRVARASGASAIAQDEAYPGWAADPSAPLVALARASVERVTGREAKVGAIHAGLECGLIKARAPTIRDAVSFGPTITGAHSPDEAVDLRTVGPFYEAVLDLMGKLADEKKKEEVSK